MTDAELELAVQRWLGAEAATTYASDALRGRILDIPSSRTATSRWHRFATVPAIGASVATASIAGVLIATMFFGLFDRPAGSEGGTCNNRQVQQALDHLRDADGLRWANREQRREFDPDAEVSFEDPQFVWADTWVSEGAYRAPDKGYDAPLQTGQEPSHGYIEHLQVGGHTYQLVEIDGTPTWTETTNWPTPNMVYGYIGAAFPAFSVPLVSDADWGGTAVPEGLPGAGGCTAATLIPVDETLPPHLVEHRAVAVRVELGSLRPTAVLIGPAASEAAQDGQVRSFWEITWTTPSADEFVAPDDFVPDPNTVEQSFIPEPSSTPLPVDPGAWDPIELPTGATGSIGDAVAGEGRYVVVGSTYSGNDPVGWIWSSSDGKTWTPVDAPNEWVGIAFSDIAWDGSTYVATGYRNYEPPEGPQYTSARPETWVSTDGLTWEEGGEIGPGEASGEVANPGRLVEGGPGWVTAGSIWHLVKNQQRPAFFVSRDGVEWTTIELDGTGSGSIDNVTVMPDESLLAIGCESPGPTNTSGSGGCYTRPWRSADGVSWTAGPVMDVEIGDLDLWGDQLIAVGYDAASSQQRDPSTTPNILMTSSDGESWEPLESFPTGPAGPNTVTVLDEELVVIGYPIDPNLSYPTAWRSSDGQSWEAISLGVPDDATSSDASGAVRTPAGLAFFGGAQIGETSSVPLFWLEPARD